VSHVATALRAQVDALDAAKRNLVIQLWRGDAMLAEWRRTLKDLNVSLDPEAVLQLQDKLSGVTQTVAKRMESIARLISDAAPRLLKQTTLQEWRQQLGKVPSLPLDIADDLRHLLDAADQNRKVVWLGLDEPVGPLPLLPWEAILRDVIAVPLVRLSPLPIDAISPRSTLDVMMICTTASPRDLIDGRVVAGACRQVLSALPTSARCVIHLFADDAHCEPVTKAIRAMKLSTIEPGLSATRGVVVYGLPSATEQASMPFEDHPWARWIRQKLAGTAVDVMHVFSDAAFPGLEASLVVAPAPRREMLDVSISGHATQVNGRVRYVGAREMYGFAKTFGAWAVILAGRTAGALRAHRALSFELARQLPGVLAVHDVGADKDSTACLPLYRLLSQTSAAVPDSADLSIQCHPGRIDPALARMSVEAHLGTEFLQASDTVRAALESPEPTPEWIGLTQRQIERTANTAFAGTATSPFEQAARDGVADALKAAMDVVAKFSKPT
jgi:hypothetical protein